MTRSDRYGALQTQCYALVGFAAEVELGLTSLGEVQRADLSRRIGERLRSESFTVLAVGERSCGKSTVVNAILGRNVLPSYAVETTATACTVKWGPEPRAVVHRSNGAATTVSVDDLAKYVAVRYGAQATATQEYREAELFWPVEMCRGGVEIVDTPALNARDGRARVTTDRLGAADVIVFVFDCDKLGSTKEFRFIDDEVRPAGHGDIFFVCNKVNLLRNAAEVVRVKQAAARKLGPRTKFGTRRIYYVNALATLEARAAQREPPRDDEFLCFERDLAEFLTQNLARMKVLRSALQLKRMTRAARPMFSVMAATLAAERDGIEKQLADANAALHRRELEHPSFFDVIRVRRESEPERHDLQTERDFLGGTERRLFKHAGRFEAIADALDDIIDEAAVGPGVTEEA